MYDHPFQWGSKRTGPDLHRIGGNYPDSWHYRHMLVPDVVSDGSIMPAYPWMIEDELDTTSTRAKISAMRTLGVPYPEGYESRAMDDLNKQAAAIAASIEADLSNEGVVVPPNTEIVALIAYLQRLGTDIEVKNDVAEASNTSETTNDQ